MTEIHISKASSHRIRRQSSTLSTRSHLQESTSATIESHGAHLQPYGCMANRMAVNGEPGGSQNRRGESPTMGEILRYFR